MQSLMLHINFLYVIFCIKCWNSHCFLFPYQSLFPLPHKIFGWTCFVYDGCPQVIKLDSKSLKCVFSCYSRTHKGYCCFPSDLGWHLIFACDFCWRFSFFVEFESFVPMYESGDSLLNYNLIDFVPLTPLDTDFQFFE